MMEMERKGEQSVEIKNGLEMILLKRAL